MHELGILAICDRFGIGADLLQTIGAYGGDRRCRRRMIG